MTISDTMGSSAPPPRSGRCRVCGCTDNDCSGCIERTGTPWYWFDVDLCSACVTPEDIAGRLRSGNAEAWRLLHVQAPYDLFVNATELLDDHPDDREGPCFCAFCQSYG